MEMHRPRARGFNLGALLAMALGGLGLRESLQEQREAIARFQERDHNRRRGWWGTGQKRYHVVRGGKRVALAPGSARPACKFIPNVAGLRYERGQYVPRRF